jgi:hypothetical protein
VASFHWKILKAGCLWWWSNNGSFVRLSFGIDRSWNRNKLMRNWILRATFCISVFSKGRGMAIDHLSVWIEISGWNSRPCWIHQDFHRMWIFPLPYPVDSV